MNSVKGLKMKLIINFYRVRDLMRNIITMELPYDVIENISSHLDCKSLYNLGKTCPDYKKFKNWAKKKQFLGRDGVFEAYRCLKFWQHSINLFLEEHIHLLSFGNDAVIHQFGEEKAVAIIHAAKCLYTKRPPSIQYREIDSELYDIVCDELKLDCPDIVLVLSLCMKIF